MDLNKVSDSEKLQLCKKYFIGRFIAHLSLNSSSLPLQGIITIINNNYSSRWFLRIAPPMVGQFYLVFQASLR